MIWRGSKPFIVGSLNEDGSIAEEFIIHPGQEFPKRAMELLKDNKPLQVPYRGYYSRELVEKKARREN